MERKFYFVVVFLLILSGVLALDAESLVGLVGDGQARGSGFGDIELAFEGRINSLPVILSVLLESTFGTNLTSENLSVSFFGVNDSDGDAVTNITDWRKDGVSVAVLNMPFDTRINTGVVKDYSTSGNNGSLVGDTTWISGGKVGGAYSFDGAGDDIDVSGFMIPNETGERTVSVWVKIAKVDTAWSMILGNSREAGNGVDDKGFSVLYRSGSISAYVYNGIGQRCGRTIISNPNIGEWYFLTVTHDNSVLSTYLNGAYVSGGACVGSRKNDESLKIGSFRGYQMYLNGSVDEVQVYDRSLSPEQISVNYQAGLAGHQNELLVSTETSKGDVWQVEVTPNDGYGDGASVLSNNLTIANSLPTVTLTSPSDWNVTVDRSPQFTWTGYDEDGDSLTYEISIQENKYSGASICNDDISDNTLTVENYTTPTDLLCLYDNGYYYNWSVRANDGIGWGAWSSVWHFNLTAEISINLASSEVTFGSLNPGDKMNTSDDNPAPFVIDNDGNVVTNISVNSSALWNEAPDNSSYFQFKVDNTPAEVGAFNWLISVVNWLDMPITGEVVGIGELNYVNGDDSAEIDILLEVPQNEAPGVKSATTLFVGELAE